MIFLDACFPSTVTVEATWDMTRFFGLLTTIQIWSFAAAHVPLLSLSRHLIAATVWTSVSTAWLTVTARMGCRKCVSLCICVHVNFVHKWILKITKWKCWKINMEVLVKKKIIFYCSSWNSCSSFVVNCHCIAAPEKFIVLCYIEPVQQNDRDLVLFLFLCSPACPESHFLCNTGLCVQKTRLCDGLDDCQDESDEVFCCKLFSN